MSIDVLRVKLEEARAEQRALSDGSLADEAMQQGQQRLKRKWELCAALAQDLLSAGDLRSGEKAYVSYVLCKGLSNLNRYTDALDPGHVGAVLAQEAGDYDLLGMTLLELAFVQGQVQGQEFFAVDTLRKFLAAKVRYSPAVQEFVGQALYNLGVTERAAQQHDAALQHFKQAWESVTRASDSGRRERFRQDYCWQALIMGDLPLAERLISLGDEYCRLHPREKLAQAHAVIDKARYALLKGDCNNAVAFAMEGVKLCDELDDAGLMSDALLTWSAACEKLGDLDSALAIGYWAHIEAQRSERPELIAQARRSLRAVRMIDREAVDRLMKAMLRPA